MQISGKVLAIKREGSRHAFLVGEEWLSTFFNKGVSADFKEAILGVEEEKEYDFECFKNPKGFINITSVLPIIQQSVPPDLEERESQPPSVQPVGQISSTDAHIIRESAAKSASRVLAAMIRSKDGVVGLGADDLVIIAKRVEEYIKTGE